MDKPLDFDKSVPTKKSESARNQKGNIGLDSEDDEVKNNIPKTQFTYRKDFLSG